MCNTEASSWDMLEGIEAKCPRGPDKVCGRRFGFQSLKGVESAEYGKGGMARKATGFLIQMVVSLTEKENSSL